MSLKMGQINSTLLLLKDVYRLKATKLFCRIPLQKIVGFWLLLLLLFRQKKLMHLLLRQRCSFAIFTMRSSSPPVFLNCNECSSVGKSLFNWQLLTTLIWPITNTSSLRETLKVKIKRCWITNHFIVEQFSLLPLRNLGRKKRETKGRGSLIDRHRKSTP